MCTLYPASRRRVRTTSRSGDGSWAVRSHPDAYFGHRGWSALGAYGEHGAGTNDLLAIGAHGAVAEGQPSGQVFYFRPHLEPGTFRSGAQVVRGQGNRGDG